MSQLLLLMPEQEVQQQWLALGRRPVQDAYWTLLVLGVRKLYCSAARSHEKQRDATKNNVNNYSKHQGTYI
jgi:hypothetical protein